MNLVIVDADSKKLYSSEELSSLLETDHSTIWYLDDEQLENEEYLLDTVTGVSGGFSRVVLLTKASHGFMNYHKKMIHNNPSIKYWVITLTQPLFEAEQQQILSEISGIFQNQDVQYVVLFDDPKTLEATNEILKEKVPEKPQCVLFFSDSTPVINHIVEALKISNPDWDILCNPENNDWVEKYANRILLFENDLDNFRDLTKINNSDRVFVWAEAARGVTNQEKEKIINNVSSLMAECGFSLTRENAHVLCGFSWFELFYAEIESGIYSYTALRNNDEFVMWDEYGLPLLNEHYEDINIQTFLNKHCVLTDFIDR